MSAANRLPSSPVTARAVLLGLFAGLLIDLGEAYNDDVLGSTLLVGNHFPLMSIVLVMALVLGLNGWIARRTRLTPLSAGELLLVWSLVGVAGGIAGSGAMRYLPVWLAAPPYYASPANEWERLCVKPLPDWMMLRGDASTPAIKWFMEGVPRGARIPWDAWAKPLAAWGGFMLALYAATFCLVALFYRQWAARERLVFPAAAVPAQMAEPAPPGRRFNAFFGNWVMWVGFGIACAIWMWNGVGSFVAGFPHLPMAWSAPQFFPDRPWSEFRVDNVAISFTVVGIIFLLPSDTSFSLWFFYLLYRLTFVYIAWLGAAGTGYWGDWDVKITIFDTAGSMFVIAAMLFWTARRYLREWFRRALAGRTDPAQDALPPLLSLLVLVAGVAGMIGWFRLAGVQWWVAVGAVVVFLVMTLVLTRVVSEAGLVLVQTSVIPFDLMAGLVPQTGVSWLTPATLAALNLQRGAVMNDLRETMMPYVMNGTDAAARGGLKLGKALGAMAVAAVLGLAVSGYSRIATCYKFGAVNMDSWSAIESPMQYLDEVAKDQTNPPEYNVIKLGGRPVLPVNVAHVLTGAALTLGLVAMRARFLWWPLHPFGLVMCSSWMIGMIWFSIFIGWLAKWAVMTFGGAKAYRKALPFFLGMVLGESVAGAFWIVVGMAAGVPVAVTTIR